MSTLINDGGRAFPCDQIIERDANGRLHRVEVSSGGMTLRDYFAAKAMQSAYFHFSNDDDGHANHWTTEGLAESAYAMADAMIKARSA